MKRSIGRLFILLGVLGSGLLMILLMARGVALSANKLESVLEISPENETCSPIIPDDHTVWLDHLDGTSIGTPVGVVTYVQSLPGLDLGADLITGTYIVYTDAPDLSDQATVEFWLNPRNEYQIVRMDLEEYSPTGYIERSYQLAIQEDWTVRFTSWPSDSQPAESLVSLSSLLTNVWTHVALSWGPAGTKLYINGQLDNMTTTVLTPVFEQPNFTYLNHGGKRELGIVDEFHLSSIQRTDDEIAGRMSCTSIAVDDSYTTTAGHNLVVPSPGVLVNDYIAVTDSVTVTLSAGPNFGQLDLGMDGSFVYTPAWPNEWATFSYQVEVANLGVDSADVTIVIVPRRTFLPLVLLQ